MQAKVDRYHAEEASLTVHDSVVESQGERATSTKRMARNQRDRWEGKIKNGVQHLGADLRLAHLWLLGSAWLDTCFCTGFELTYRIECIC